MVPVALHPQQHLLFSVFLIIAILVGVKWYLVVLIYIFLMANHIENLTFIRHLYIIFVEMSIHILSYFLIGLFFILLLSCKGSLLWIQLPYHFICKKFLLLCGFSVYLLGGIDYNTKVFILVKSHYLFFFFKEIYYFK